MFEKVGHHQIGLHWCQGNLTHLHKMQTETFYMALLVDLLLLVMMELRLFSSTEYFTLGFFNLTGLPAAPSC